MPNLSNTLSAIKRKAKKNDVEVEHLLKVVPLGDVRAVPTLRSLKEEYAWPNGLHSRGHRVIPLGKWVDVICFYLTDGLSGLVNEISKELSLKGRVNLTAELAFDVMKEVRTPKSVKALLQIGNTILKATTDNLHSARVEIRLVCDALNDLLYFKPPVKVSPAIAKEARTMLHQVVVKSANGNVLSSAYCAYARLAIARPLN